MQADPPSNAARGCGGREEPTDSKAGKASQAARQAEEEPEVQPGEGEPRHACGGEEESHNIQDVAGASGVAGRAGSVALVQTTAGELQHQWRYVAECG